jgi:hypothetical protein
MPFESCDTAPYPIPLTDVMTIVPAGSWSAGAWNQLTADCGAAALMLLGVGQKVWMNYAGMGGQAVVEVGVGAAGAETMIAQTRVNLAQLSYAGTVPSMFALPVNAIPAHSRIAVRTRIGSGSDLGRASIHIIVQPVPENVAEIEVAPGVPKVGRPTANALTSTFNNTALEWSAWLQLIASAPNDLVLSAWKVYTAQGASGADVEYQFGVGAAGNETPLLTWQGWISQLGQTGMGAMGAWPLLYEVASGQRIAARARKTTVGTPGWGADIGYFEVLP